MMPPSSKVCINMHVQRKRWRWSEDEAFVLGGEKIPSDTLYCQFMYCFRVGAVAGALMHCHADVRTGIVCQVI